MEIESYRAKGNSLLKFSKLEEFPKIKESKILQDKKRRYPIWTEWSFSVKRRIIVEGLPEIIVEVKPFKKRTIRIPDDFLREIVLIHTPETLVKKFSNQRVTLMAFCSKWKKPISLEDFKGEPLWLGCGEEVKIPERILEKWEKINKGPENDVVLKKARVLSPEPLEKGQKICLQLVYSGKTKKLKPIIVEVYKKESDFPQEEMLQENK